MCEICSKRKADMCLFLSEHAPQLGIRSARAQVAWSELHAIARDVALLPAVPPEQEHAAHEDHAKRMGEIMQGLSLAELEEIFFASTVLWMTGNLHRLNSSGLLKQRWRSGERDPQLTAEAIASLEASIAHDDAAKSFRNGVAAAIAQAFGGDAGAQSQPGATVSVFVPGNGKPVPPS